MSNPAKKLGGDDSGICRFLQNSQRSQTPENGPGWAGIFSFLNKIIYFQLFGLTFFFSNFIIAREEEQ